MGVARLFLEKKNRGMNLEEGEYELDIKEKNLNVNIIIPIKIHIGEFVTYK
jgi:hypothetical protein